MRRMISYVSDLYSILDSSNIQLSNKQKDSLVNVLYPNIEHSVNKAYKLGKQSNENKKERFYKGTE